MQVNREHLLAVLEAVSIGIARSPSFQQAGCFVFDKEHVLAFNGDVACSGSSPLGEIHGAVAAGVLLEFLRKLKEEDLEITNSDGALKIKGKGRRMKFAMEEKILLPLEGIEKPESWLPLHEDFCEAAGMVSACAGKDEKWFDATCVNVHPQWLEAFDGSQMMRHRLSTGVSERFLVQKTAMKQVCVMGMTQWAITDRWVHFKNGNDFVLSCLRYPELEFYDLSAALKIDGDKVHLPKGLAQAAELAELASSENKDDNVVHVTLRSGEVWIEGKGITAEYQERRKVGYEGPEISFCMAPKILATLVEKYSEAYVTKERLVVDGGKWRYAVMLKLPAQE